VDRWIGASLLGWWDGFPDVNTFGNDLLDLYILLREDFPTLMHARSGNAKQPIRHTITIPILSKAA